jgi:type II restriction enzyme
MNVTAANIVSAINKLSRSVYFDYPNAKTKTKVRVVSVELPVGPIKIERSIPKTVTPTEVALKKEEDGISTSMIQRYAHAFSEGIPVNIDRVLGASYNTRSALEALLAHTPEFYLCYPKRIEMLDSSSEIKKGHKHLIWNPKSPHKDGEIHTLECDLTITERPSVETVYGVVDFPVEASGELDIEIKRRHTQIQIALARIGHQLGFRTYIAANDQSIQYNQKPLVSLPGVVSNLSQERLLTAFAEGVDAAKFIDCVWFKNGKLMPAVMEIEHSTGVTSGLARMQKFKNAIPPYPTRWVIVAPDEDRSSVITKCSDPQFKGLNAKYFPYSAVEELYALCEKRKIRGVDEEFLDCFMESAA